MLLRSGFHFVSVVVLAFSAVASPISAAPPILKLASGFSVERVYSVPRGSQGSWIALTADQQGRLYVADQYGPVYRIQLARVAAEIGVTRLPLEIGGVHGFAWVGSDLYAVAGQRAVSPPGLYRLCDTNHDGELDELKLLRALDGDGEHGPHAVVPSPDGKSLYVIAGNGTRRPELVRSRVPPLWGEDSPLPPLPAVVGSETRGHLGGGWVCRTDLDGREWELVSSGLRNAYALAIDPWGELFTFDSDTEFEINLPWYRPTRVLHLVSGADFGWRRGRYKVPDRAPDGWPALLPLGLGSPTAVLFPREARFPERYRRALWVADWSYGKLHALHLREAGAGFTAEAETILSGIPLPITAVCVNPGDGALYFTTGGRRTSSELFRLSWNGSDSPVASPSEAPAAPSPAVAQRHALESFHGRADSGALSVIWPQLGSDDPLIRRAARTALEAQPVATWRDRALSEKNPRSGLAALLALVRIEARENQDPILDSLRTHLRRGVPANVQTEALRVLTLALTRGGDLSAQTRAAWGTVLEETFPAGSRDADSPTLIELLIALDSRSGMQRGFAALQQAASREAQLDIARSLRARPASWSATQRSAYFAWLSGTSSWRGGASFALLLKNLRAEALTLASPAERASLETAFAASTAPVISLPARATATRQRTVDHVIKLVETTSGPRNVEHGRRMFAAAGCFVCHTFAGEGGSLGPDLTGIASRVGVRDLLEAIIEPNREISDQYGTVEITLRNGAKHSGRIINYTEQGLQLAENLLDHSNARRIPETEITAIEPSRISLMPAGLLDSLNDTEILDLLAFLRAPAISP
jgi:putative heme-binding domain-containing protein